MELLFDPMQKLHNACTCDGQDHSFAKKQNNEMEELL